MVLADSAPRVIKIERPTRRRFARLRPVRERQSAYFNGHEPGQGEHCPRPQDRRPIGRSSSGCSSRPTCSWRISGRGRWTAGLWLGGAACASSRLIYAAARASAHRTHAPSRLTTWWSGHGRDHEHHRHPAAAHPRRRSIGDITAGLSRHCIASASNITPAGNALEESTRHCSRHATCDLHALSAIRDGR